ncbi:hypothetical protein FH972_012813 [Carpinus fangiana]|uniref:Protein DETOXIFICATION n=1 Tax=Carpinus fangiana TaxID=176857 RepID=A0A5N6R4U9_9ROSI|nr:hypothetical protein FH972_012813 [Carpinus fangiana]
MNFVNSLNTSTLHYNMPYGVGAAARQPEWLAVGAVTVLAVAEAGVVSSALYCSRHVLGYAYSNEKEVEEYVAKMVPLLCLSVSMDSLLGGLQEAVDGSKWRPIYVNLGAYYLEGIPVAVLFSFVLHLRGRGLWIGILTGFSVQAIILSFITASTDWHKQVVRITHLAQIKTGKEPPRIEVHASKAEDGDARVEEVGMDLETAVEGGQEVVHNHKGGGGPGGNYHRSISN